MNEANQQALEFDQQDANSSENEKKAFLKQFAVFAKEMSSRAELSSELYDIGIEGEIAQMYDALNTGEGVDHLFSSYIHLRRALVDSIANTFIRDKFAYRKDLIKSIYRAHPERLVFVVIPNNNYGETDDFCTSVYMDYQDKPWSATFPLVINVIANESDVQEKHLKTPFVI